MCAPVGYFSVVPKKAELSKAVPYACCVVRLLPYEQHYSTKKVAGLTPSWNSTLTLEHSDGSIQPKLRIEIHEDPPNGARKCLGTADVDLLNAILQPDTTVEHWIPLNGSSGNTKANRVMISLCFHRRSSLRSTSLRKTVSNLSVEDTAWQIRGKCSFELKGIHICGNKCSISDGHTTFSAPEFSPIVRISFEGTYQDVVVPSGDLSDIQLKDTWSVHSVHSDITVEILKKASVTGHPSSARHLSDGKSALCVADTKISLFEVLERNADAWTKDKWPEIKGPGGVPAEKGFAWFPLRHGSDEVGLVMLRVSFAENFMSLLDKVPHPDAIYLDPEEEQFDPAIIKRNTERVDEILSGLKDVQEFATDVLEWKSPPLTIAVWLGIVLFIFRFPTEHSPVVIIGGLLVIIAVNLKKRYNGSYRQRYICHNPDDKKGFFRPLANLKVAPIEACNLKAPENKRLDPFVRVYYEPNFKNQPPHLIAQTDASHGNLNPVWGGSNHESEKTEAILKAHRAWFTDLIHHLTKYEQDAVLRDIVEPWPRSDGTVDSHAYKYPLLQPVQTTESKRVELIPWQNAPGMIRFDVVNGGPLAAVNEVMGQVRVPLRQLMSPACDTAGGPQPELDQIYQLQKPSTLSKESPLASDATGSLGTLRVRLQISLRNPNDPILLKDRLAQDAMYSVTEMASEKTISLFQRYHQIKDLAVQVQNVLGSICTTIERFQSILSWSNPERTLKIVGILVVLLIVTYQVPLRYIIMIPLTKAVRSNKGREWNLINSFVVYQTISPLGIDRRDPNHEPSE